MLNCNHLTEQHCNRMRGAVHPAELSWRACSCRARLPFSARPFLFVLLVFPAARRTRRASAGPRGSRRHLRSLRRDGDQVQCGCTSQEDASRTEAEGPMRCPAIWSIISWEATAWELRNAVFQEA